MGRDSWQFELNNILVTLYAIGGDRRATGDGSVSPNYGPLTPPPAGSGGNDDVEEEEEEKDNNDDD